MSKVAHLKGKILRSVYNSLEIDDQYLNKSTDDTSPFIASCGSFDIHGLENVVFCRSGPLSAGSRLFSAFSLHIFFFY
jgi:hypothetical protein